MTPAQKLFAYRRLDSREAVTEFESALQEIGERGVTSAELPELLRCLDDNTHKHDVMWGLVHLVETVPDHLFVHALVAEAPQMAEHAAGWQYGLVAGALNTPNCRAAFVAEFRGAPRPQQDALKPSLERLAGTQALGRVTAAELLRS